MKQTNWFGQIKDKIKAVVEESTGEERKPRAKWYDFRLQFPSQRDLRRQRDRDIDRQTRRYRRGQLNAHRAQRRVNESTAVKVLAAYEASLGLKPGELREQLIAEDKLVGTRDKIVGWEDATIMTEDLKGQPTIIDVKRPITVPVPIGHHVTEILAAAGLDAKAIEALHGQLLGESDVEVSA